MSRNRKHGNNSITNYFSKKAKPEVHMETDNESTYQVTQQIICNTEVCTPDSQWPVNFFSEDSDPHDIGHYQNTKLDNDEKLDILENIWIPGNKFIFPSVGKRNLKFQLKWLGKWSWLVYSNVANGVYCKFCFLFGTGYGGMGNQKLGYMCTTVFNNWKDAIERFYNHQNCAYHMDSIEIADNLIKIRFDKQLPINQQLDNKLKEEVIKNRKMIIPIVEAILFCGKQGLPLRGHRDSGLISVLKEPDNNEGNFRALLRFRAKIDDDFENFLTRSKRNAQYTSPIIQNEIIDICNFLILKSIVEKVNQSSYFSVIADGSTDISCIEQLALSVRFITAENQLQELFLQFIPITDFTGKGISEVILHSLISFGIDISKMRGQGYDGAASMSGVSNGVQAHIRKTCPMAIYTHCAAHSLNLAISSASNSSPIRNCMGTLSTIYDFFNTPKRQNVLQSIIDKHSNNDRTKKLKQLCATRWVDRHNSVFAFVELFDSVIEALNEISVWHNNEAAIKAKQYMCSINDVEFIISLLCMKNMFSLTLPLCKMLQAKHLDLLQAINLADDVMTELKILRRKANSEFQKIFNDVLCHLQLYDLEIKIPRRYTKQIQRCNVETDSPEEYYRISIFIPLLDHFINQLDIRFLSHRTILKGFNSILPTNQKSEINIEDLKHLIDFYSEDPDIAPYDEIIPEARLWRRRLNSEKFLPSNAIDALNICNPLIYANIHKYLLILAVLPVSSCTSERSFSTLRRLKTYLRNSISNDRLNGLALLYIHRHLTPNVNDIVNELCKKKRKLHIKL